MKAGSSSELHHISAQNNEKHILSTSIFQNFLEVHAPRPLQRGHACSVNNIYAVEDLTLCKQIKLRALVMPKYKVKQTASSLLINGLHFKYIPALINKNMQLDYLFTNCIKSSKFSKVIFKKHNLKVYANYVQIVILCLVMRLLFKRGEFIMICFGSLERDYMYSLFRGVITLDKG